MPDTAAEIARRLAREAEAVCRHYLSNGRREGRYWMAGDVENTPGRSLFVRLSGSDFGKGGAGKWKDAATGEDGDLLDLIAAARKLDTLSSVLDEAHLTPAATARAAGLDQARPSPAGLTRSGTTAVGNLAADPLHGRRHVSSQSRHHGSTELRLAPPSPAMLVSRGSQRYDRSHPRRLACAHRLSPRRQRQAYRRAPHLARG